MARRMIPLNAATCTHCGSKNTQRIGFSKEKNASVWACQGCKRSFQVLMIVMVPSPKVR